MLLPTACCLLCISDASFKALFRAVDGDCDGSIRFEDFEAVVFPDVHRSQLRHELEQEQQAAIHARTTLAMGQLGNGALPAGGGGGSLVNPSDEPRGWVSARVS